MEQNNDECVDESAIECDNVSKVLCYNADVVHDCCDTCFRLSTTDPLCRYGDKELGCLSSLCSEYTENHRFNCCLTCANFTNGKGNVSNLSGRDTKSILPQQGSGLQGWVVPVSASAAVVILVLVSIIVFLLARRSKCHPHIIPKRNLETLKRNNWGFVIQRAPLPPPRPEVTDRFQDYGHTYDYAEPEYIQIPPPGVYLEFVSYISGDNQQSMGSDVKTQQKLIHSFENTAYTNEIKDEFLKPENPYYLGRY